MPNAARILERKGGGVVSIGPDATVLEAAQLMNEHRIGSLVVVRKHTLVGIFTERDVMQRVVAAQRDPASTRVGDVMTANVACAKPDTRSDELRLVMREKRIRHIPVLDGRRVVGLVSIGDLNRADAEVRERTIEYLEQFISVA